MKSSSEGGRILARKQTWPEEGDLLVCIVKSVSDKGAYLEIDGLDGVEGFVFIGEVAAGWVKSVRSYLREGQRVVAKAIGVKQDRGRIDLSIKSVSDERRRDALQFWKNEQRAGQIMKVAAERVKWSEDELDSKSDDLVDAFGSLYGALEEAAGDPDSLSNAGFSGDWTTTIVELAVENIVPESVKLKGSFHIEIWSSEGVAGIMKVLEKAEESASSTDEVTLTCHYDGAPNYRVEIEGPDYNSAESAWEACVKAAESEMAAFDGKFAADRV